MARAFGGSSADARQAGVRGAFSALVFYEIGSHFQGVQEANATSGTSTWGNTGLTQGQYIAKVVAHGVAGGVMSSLQGGKFGHGFASAGITQGFAPGIDRIDAGNMGFSAQRTIMAALVGGSVSELTGGKFANGAMTAAFSRAFNDDKHYRKSMVSNSGHDYEINTPLCSSVAPECNGGFIWGVTDAYSIPFEFSAGPHEGYRELFGLFSPNPITHIHNYEMGMIVNVAHPEHIFAGTVTHRIYESNGIWYLNTIGNGPSIGVIGNHWNNLVGLSIFGNMHRNVSLTVRFQVDPRNYNNLRWGE